MEGDRAIHDWRQGRAFDDMVRVFIRPEGDEADRPAMLAWTGTAGKSGEAQAAAVRAASIAWRVASAPEGRPAPRFSASAPEPDRDEWVPGIRLLKRFDEETGHLLRDRVFPLTNEESLQAAACVLRAAAARALLGGDEVEIAVGSGTDLTDIQDDDHLRTAISIRKASRCTHVAAEGPLLDAMTALAVARHISRGFAPDPDPWIRIPESATLRALLAASLAEAAGGEAAKAAAFLRRIGVPDIADAFAAAYGQGHPRKGPPLPRAPSTTTATARADGKDPKEGR